MARQRAQPVISHEEVKRRRAQARHRERNIKRLKAVLSMCGIVLVGTVYYAADPLEHKGWGDAFYMCVITVTTVGFGDFSPSSARGRIFAGAVCVLVGGGSPARPPLLLPIRPHLPPTSSRPTARQSSTSSPAR